MPAVHRSCLIRHMRAAFSFRTIQRDSRRLIRDDRPYASNRANDGRLREGNCGTEGKTMTTLETTKSKNSSGVTRSGRLFVLELSGDRIHSMNPDGSDRKTIVTNCRFPDGIGVDSEAGHIYWTNKLSRRDAGVDPFSCTLA